VSNIRIANSSVDFDDQPVGVKHQVTDIDVAIPFISNLPRHLKQLVQPRFSAMVNGAPLRIRGETLPFEDSLRTHIALQLEEFDLPRYAGYSPSPLPVKLDAGKLGGRIEVRFTQAHAKEPNVELTGNLLVKDLAVSTPQRELGRIALLSADGIQVNLLAREVKVGSVAASGGSLALQRRADGSLELPVLTAASTAQAEAQKPWRASLAKLTVDGFSVALADESVKPCDQPQGLDHPCRGRRSLDRYQCEAPRGRESGAGEGRHDRRGFHRRARSAGGRGQGGRAAHRPRAAAPLRRILQDREGEERARLGKGDVQLRGDKSGMKVAYAGSAEVSRFATFDTTINEDLLNWDKVRAERVAFKWAKDEPLDLAVGDIDVVKVYSRVVVTPEGRINLQQLKLATDDNPAPAPQAKEDLKPRNVRIDRVRFVDSRLNFTDHYIKPNYTADVGELNGTVTGLSSDPAARAVVDLKGSYDKSAPVVISGTVNPLSGTSSSTSRRGQGHRAAAPVGVLASLRGLSDHAGQAHARREVPRRGRQARRAQQDPPRPAHLRREGRRPRRDQAPVLFAVNLLKDANGRIDLELPIKGSLEDPQFDMGALIGQVVSNLLKKALTAPFSLLAAAFGGGADPSKAGSGEDLQYIAFAPERTRRRRPSARSSSGSPRRCSTARP
jgi:hypothetical protein